MAVIKLYRDRLQDNYLFLAEILKKSGIEWGVVTKLLCGDPAFLQEIIRLGVTELHDSRVSNLKAIKKLAPQVQTVYIKPPPKRSIRSIVKYADVSFNTELNTICLLSEEAMRQGKAHKIIIMLELGDLREGVMGEELVDFYSQVFKLPGVSIIGLGTNLTCLHGIIPNQDKLTQLTLYKQIIELKFNRKIPWISGGTTVTLPLLLQGQLPEGINHFRIGDGLYFGPNLITGETIPGLRHDVFELFAEIIELTEKPMVPYGEMGQNVQGESYQLEDTQLGKRSMRAILDVGLLDVDPTYLIPRESELSIAGASSDMLVIDLGKNEKGYKVGDFIRFHLKYMGALHLISSSYIQKMVDPGCETIQDPVSTRSMLSKT